MDAAKLGERWGISVRQAALTLKATTQRYIRWALMPLSRRYIVDRMFVQKTFNAHVYTDTMNARVKLIHGNRYGQLFATKDFFVNVYLMKSKRYCGDTLHEFFSDYGVPLNMTLDGSKNQNNPGTDFIKPFASMMWIITYLIRNDRIKIHQKVWLENYVRNGFVPWFANKFLTRFGITAIDMFVRRCNTLQASLAD